MPFTVADTFQIYASCFSVTSPGIDKHYSSCCSSARDTHQSISSRFVVCVFLRILLSYNSGWRGG